MAEVASAFVSIMPSAKGFGSKLDSEISGDVTKSGKKAGSKWGDALKTGAAVGVAALGAVVVKTLSDSVTAASEAQQAVGGVEAVFGKYADTVLSDSKKAAQGLGLSATAYNELITVSGAMLKNKGIKDFADQSKSLVTVGADLAAMFGGSTTEAVEALNSAMRGESDPIEKYGIALNAAAIEAEAVSTGLVKNVKDVGKIKAAQNSALVAQRKYNEALKENGKGSNEALAAESSLIRAKAALSKSLEGEKIALTGAQKAQASLSLIQKQSSDSTGAFARESNTLAGQQARLGAQFDNLKVTVGTKLLPVLTSVAAFLNTNLQPAFRDVGTTVTSTAGFVDRHRVALTSLAVAIGAVVLVTKLHSAAMAVQAAGGLAALIKSTVVVTKLTKAYAAVQWVLNAALSANPIGLVVIALVALGAGLVVAYKKSETFRRVVDNAFAGVRAIAQDVANFVTTTVPQAFATAAASVVASWNTVKGGAKAALTYIQAIPGKIAVAFAGAGTLLYGAGVKLMVGLANGIRAGSTLPISATAAALRVLKNMLPGSPIKAGPLKPWNNGRPGELLMGFLAKGITKGGKQTRDAMTAQLDKLKDTLSTLKSDFKSLAESVSSSFTGDLFGVSATEADIEAGVAGSSVGQNFIAGLMAKKGELTALLSSFKTLAGWGIAPSFLSQLFASGNGALITELAGMGQAGAVGAADLFGQVSSLGSQLGSAVATNDFGPNIDRVGDKIDGLTAEIKKLPKEISKANANTRIVLEGDTSGRRAYLRTGK